MMEDETWLIVSSSDEAYDSDKIDSDIEAELYSILHHGTDTVTSPIDNSICQSPQAVTDSKASKTPRKDEFSETPPGDTNFESTERKELGNCSSDEVQIIHSSSKSKKRKSDLLDNMLESTELESNNGDSSKQSNCANDARPYKKQRSNSNGNLKKKSNKKSVLNRTVELHSSDSDSIIWTEADDCDVKLKTNLDNEEIVLTSDSFSSDNSCSPFLGDNSFTTSPANISQPSTSSFSKKSNDLWYVNSEDIYRSKRPSSRYHERAVLHCSNCNLRGHSIKFCSVPKAVKCFICGGAHMGSRCKDKLCHRCFRPGHDTRFCNQRLVSICVHCNMKGHSAKHCPDLWRRYHLTTNERNIVMGHPLAQNTPLYCFNCGQKGHYGAQCKVPRIDRLSFPTWTNVIAYVHPFDTIQRANGIQRNAALGGISEWSPNFRPTPHQQMPIYRQPPPQFQLPFNRQLPPQMQMLINRPPPPQMRMLINRQPAPQMQMLINRQPAPQMQIPVRQPPPQNQLPIKKKKNKKKKNCPANNSQTSPVSMKKKKNKANSPPQTPGSSTKKTTQKEVYFPRTPANIYERRLQKKLRKQQRKLERQQTRSSSFMKGLYKRLGLSNSNAQN